MATATGGVWKTVNNGTTLETVFDHESTSSVATSRFAIRAANGCRACARDDRVDS